MIYLRLFSIPVLAGLLAAALSSCPKKPDETNVAVDTAATPPSTTTVDTTNTPPADTNVNVNVTTDAKAPVVVAEDVKTKYPDVVTVLEKEVATPADTTVYVANSPAIETWKTKIVPANAPADVAYFVRDFNVTNPTDTEITGNGYVLVAAPDQGFASEKKYVTYTFTKDTASNQWLISNLTVDRTEPATAEEVSTVFGTSSTAGGTTGGTDTGAGAAGGSTGGDTGGAGGSAGGNTGGGTGGGTGSGG